MQYFQDSLFPAPQAQSSSGSYQLSKNGLAKWQERVRTYQQAVLAEKPAINPYKLKAKPLEFFRLSSRGGGDACIYFVIDLTAEIILYIGETCRSDRRWQGEHDCKGYLENYRNAHQAHALSLEIICTFWWDTAINTSDRQHLETQLIHQWRSPFNKQNWKQWQTPFL